MRRSTLVLSTICAGLAAATAFGQAQAAKAPSKSWFDGIYAELNQSVKAKNFGAMEALFRKHAATKFTYVHSDGRRLTGKQMMDEMKMSLGPKSVVLKSTSRILSIKSAGKDAIVTTVGDYAFRMPYTDGKPHVFGGSSTSRDVWISTPAGYKLSEVRIVKETMTMDGKPVRM